MIKINTVRHICTLASSHTCYLINDRKCDGVLLALYIGDEYCSLQQVLINIMMEPSLSKGEETLPVTDFIIMH